MKKQLDALLQRYTDQHPDVVGTRRVIEQLEAQKKQEVESRRKSGGMSGSLGANPVYQQLKLSLSESEANVASLQTRVAEYEARLGAMRGSQRMLPEMEAEFAQLNRDYEINKKNYESLVSRREAANMSVEMDASSGVAEFRLIDPPSVPSKPAAPNRALLMPASGLVSLGIGLLVAFLVFQVRPIFFDGRALRDVTGLPVLGVVTMIDSPSRAKRERMHSIYFAGGLLSLVGIFALMTAVLALRAFGL